MVNGVIRGVSVEHKKYMSVQMNIYEQAEDGSPYSDYYDSYQGNNEQEEEEQQGVYNVMVKVFGAKENASMVANFASSLNINLDSYCMRHMTPCYELQNPKPCVVNILCVGVSALNCMFV